MVKRVGCLLLVAVLILGLAGCGTAGRNSYGLLDRLLDQYMPIPGVEEEPVDSMEDLFTGDQSQAEDVDEPAAQEITLYTTVSKEVLYYKDLQYKTVVGAQPEATQFDICGPAQAATAPGEKYPFIMFVSGGSWHSINKESLKTYLITLAHYGWVAASINTRTLPEAGYAAQLEDVLDAFKFFGDNAANFAIDPANMFLVGMSSGGNLALVGAYTQGKGFVSNTKASSYVYEMRGVAALAAPVMMEQLGLSFFGESADVQTVMQGPSAEKLTVFLGEGLTEDLSALRRLDPREYVTANCPPTLLMQGEMDTTVPPENAQVMYDSLLAAGVPAALMRYADVDHVVIPEKQVITDLLNFFTPRIAA